MEDETEAIESGIGIDHDSVQAEETLSAFIGRMNDQFQSWDGDNITTVNSCAVACSAGRKQIVDSDRSHANSSYASISFAVLLKQLKVIFGTETLGAVPVDTHGINTANAGFGQTFLVEAGYTKYPQAFTMGQHSSFPRAFQQIQNVSSLQLGVVSSITNRSNKDSNRYSIDATNESQKKR